MTIPFSPPDIGQREIDAVTQVLRSGWLTTGPRTKAFEEAISRYCGTGRTVCLNSATAALELTLRLLGIGPGDEVITSAYTYTATAAVILHTGATPVLIDTLPGTPHWDMQALARHIGPRTKAILAVDLAGRMADYPALLQLAEGARGGFSPASPLQQALGRPAVLADAAHSFGARLGEQVSGSLADFTCFSFHAVKNLTTGEGGAVTWRGIPGCPDEEIYRQFQLLSLHGQDKDALAKSTGGWEYDILLPGYKCNMTDLMAAIGLVQLERYPQLLERRRELYHLYRWQLHGSGVALSPLDGPDWQSSYHLAMASLPVAGADPRGRVAAAMARAGIGCNVHYKPLPLLTAYRRLGFDPARYPNAMAYYSTELTLPLHTLLTNDQVVAVARTLRQLLAEENGRPLSPAAHTK